MSDTKQTTAAMNQLPIAGESDTMVGLTDAAAAEVKRLMESQQLGDDFCLRLGVVGGGCSGLTYQVNFDNESGKFDKVFEIKGVRVIVDLKSALYLKGIVIDYVPAIVGGGFKFSNPNASKSCGCGTSFSA
ncbi:MAG TPA: iron-sulfur cluster assembly accessory protein [candidate division Zixibacteria bacterium]|jgi:iron-sulfur cluster assembly protein